MTTPEQVDVWVGLDVGKEEHFAEVLDNDGERIFAGSVVNDQAALEALLDRAEEQGTVGLVIDQPGSIAQLALAVARGRQVPVAYVPGLVMRRAADLYPGEANQRRIQEPQRQPPTQERHVPRRVRRRLVFGHLFCRCCMTVNGFSLAG